MTDATFEMNSSPSANVMLITQVATIMNKKPGYARELINRANVEKFKSSNGSFYYSRESFDEKFPQYVGIEADPIKLEEVSVEWESQKKNAYEKSKSNKQNKRIQTDVNFVDSFTSIYVKIGQKIGVLAEDNEFEKISDLVSRLKEIKETETKYKNLIEDTTILIG